MSDYLSTDLAGAAYLAEEEGFYDDRPSRHQMSGEFAQRSGPPVADPYVGNCGGCGTFVSPSVGEGSCLHTAGTGPWHPACRDADRQAERIARAA